MPNPQKPTKKPHGGPTQPVPHQVLGVWINDVIGVLPAVVIRDASTDPHARQVANTVTDERVVEVRYTDGPSRGQTAFVPDRNLRADPRRARNQTSTDWAQQAIAYRIQRVQYHDTTPDRIIS